MQHIYDFSLYSGCPPLKLILYNKEQVQDAINGLSTHEACSQVLSFMGCNISDGGDHSSSGGDEQSSRKGSSGKKGVSKTSSKGAKGRASKASTSTSTTNDCRSHDGSIETVEMMGHPGPRLQVSSLNQSNLDNHPCHGFHFNQQMQKLPRDYARLTSHVFFKILDIFEICYTLHSLEDITSELSFKNFEDLEKTIYIFENFTNNEWEHLMEERDKLEKLQTLLQALQREELNAREHTIQSEAEITTMTEL